MATSGNPILTTTANEIITDAFAELNLYGVDENISDGDTQLAYRKLNRLIKTWMAKGYHVWLKRIAFLFTKKDQREYNLSSASTDNVTLKDFGKILANYSNTLSADAAASATSVDVISAADITVGDYFGVILNNNDIYWTVIDSIASNTINFQAGDSLPSAASSGNTVYFYTTKLSNPFNVYSAVRNENGRDIIMTRMAYETYFQQPNKDDTTATPVDYVYDRQLDRTLITLWPTPNRSDIVIKLTLSRQIEIFEDNANNPDFPQEWHDALVLNLAISLASSFGRNIGDRYTNLKLDAQQALDDALSFDNEVGSVYLSPDFQR